jgi:hypothetical protein
MLTHDYRGFNLSVRPYQRELKRRWTAEVLVSLTSEEPTRLPLTIDFRDRHSAIKAAITMAKEKIDEDFRKQDVA